MATIQARRTKSGDLRYKATIRLKGHPTETATFHRETDAKRWIQDTESAIREGRHFKTSVARRRTVGELIARYVDEVLPTKPRSAPKQLAQLEWWHSEIGALTLANVTPDILADCRNKLLRGPGRRGENRSPSTVVRYMAALSHVFSVAVREYGWIESNPMRKVTKPKEPAGRSRFLSDLERDRLLEACRASDAPYLYPIVVLALSTGMRQGEILGLDWDDVDLRSGTVTLRETKNGETRVVPLAGHALEVMRSHAKVRRLDSILVFPSPRDPTKPWSPRAPWNKALAIADLKDFRFHDLRHSAASYLAMNGATPPEIAAVLGHKTLQMVKRYAHLSEPHTRDLVARMNQKIFG